MKDKKVFTTGDVARICNVSVRTAQKWFDEGLLKGYKLPNSKDRRVRAEKLVEFMTKHDMPVEDWLKEKQGQMKK